MSPKDRDGWLTRWREGRIQFHVDTVNPILDRYVDRLLPEGFGRVFVPLCGKSVDLGWLYEQGREVVSGGGNCRKPEFHLIDAMLLA